MCHVNWQQLFSDLDFSYVGSFSHSKRVRKSRRFQRARALSSNSAICAAAFVSKRLEEVCGLKVGISYNSSTWITDSGASQHMSPYEDLFASIGSKEVVLHTADHKSPVPARWGKLKPNLLGITDCLYHPGLSWSLFSHLHRYMKQKIISKLTPYIFSFLYVIPGT